jgi:inosine triphosphate pyrophosphatase
MKITFVTGNKQKAAELARLLDHPVENIEIDQPEIQSLSLKEIAYHKATQAKALVSDGAVLVEDTGLRFHAFDKLPGPFIKWFYKKLHNEGLVRMLEGFTDRRASAEICYCLYDGKEAVYFEGRTGGEIAREPKGGQGFGWDAIFIPNGHTKTWGQMDAEEKDATSMRAGALAELREYLLSVK